MAPLAAALAACGGGGGFDEPSTRPAAAGAASVAKRTAAATSRSWYMGFVGTPPRADIESFLINLSLWQQRADMATIQFELPWAALIDGVHPDTLVANEHLGLVNYYRSRGMKVLLVPELNDPLAREAETPRLRAMGRSLTEPEVQDAYRRYVLAAARILQPDWLCLGVETNLVRLAAPSTLYEAVKRCANDTAAELKATRLPSQPVLTSVVQVETAWGMLPGQDGSFLGIEPDRADFAFAECLGLSSYPYLSWSTPDEIPADWYSRLVGQSAVPVMVTECGWSSGSTAFSSSTEEQQRRYIDRHVELLESVDATAVVHLYFTDIDVAALPRPLPANLPLFTSIGLCNSAYEAKPALAAWDAQFALPLATRSV